MEDLRDETEHEHVLALVLRGAAERFDREAGDRHAEINEALVVEIRLDVVAIVKEDAALFQEADVILVAVLVERDEEVGFVARGEHFAGADAHLEDRRPPEIVDGIVM
jgi:hypothetical protein